MGACSAKGNTDLPVLVLHRSQFLLFSTTVKSADSVFLFVEQLFRFYEVAVQKSEISYKKKIYIYIKHIFFDKMW